MVCELLIFFHFTAGVVLYEIFERKRPYYRMNNSEVIDFVLTQKGHLDRPTLIEYPQEIWLIMLACFE